MEIFVSRYRDMTHTLKDNVDEACEYLLENFEEEFLGNGSQQTGDRTARQKGEILFSDGDSSLGDSSLNQVMASLNLR